MKILQTALLAGALSLTAACASSFNADVSRFQRLPAPTGETYAIVAKDPEMVGGLEFYTYSQYVADELAQYGYAPASSPEMASLLVKLDYGVSDGREKIVSRPGFGFGGYYGHGYFPYYYGGFHRSRFHSPFFYGRGYGFYDNDIYSYTVYRSFLDMDIVRPDGTFLFEGRAEADTRDNDLPELVPQLVTAMFTDFPGASGQTVRVKVPTD